MPEQQKVKGIVDIVFLVDATGSMQDCIDALKASISTFVESLSARNANNAAPVKDWRAKVVGYRDFEVDETPFEDNPFVRDAAQLKAQLNALQADGGGDEPESLLDALYKVVDQECTEDAPGVEEDTKWRHRHQAARVVVIFTDATYKETMKLAGHEGGRFEDVANLIHANRVIVSLFTLDFPIYFDTIAALDKAEYNKIPRLDGQSPQKAMEAYVSDQAVFRRTLEQLAKSISKSAEVPIL